MNTYIKMLKDYRNSHPKASDEYEKGFMAWINEAIAQIKISDKIEKEND
jgi:hypothetical protein